MARPVLRTRLCDILDIEYPVILAGMGGVATAELVAAVSEAGGLGGLGGIYREGPEYLRQQIRQTRDLTSKPFSVNLWVFLLDVAPQFLDVCIEEKVPSVTLTFGDPGEYARRAKDAGIRVLHQVQTVAAAKRAAEAGVDVIIAQGGEGGGHTGSVATIALVPQAVDVAGDIPVIAAGGIADGRGLVAALALGAQGVIMGTRFVAAEECIAHPRFKEAFVRAAARDAMPTTQFDPSLPTIPVRAILNEGTKDFNRLQLDLLNKVKAGEVPREEAQVKLEEFWVGALRRAVVEGDVEHGSLMAGQSVAFVKKIQPVREILDDLVGGAEAALARMAGEG